jgi:signal transduction histidine kinase
MALLEREELQREGELLAARAGIPLRLPIPEGRAPVESRGLFLVCSAPVTAADGRVAGHLYGGRLLNGNFPLVDRIMNVIYGGESHQGLESGSATLFLGDVRVATTVRLPDGERAVGTRVSTQVAEAVLGKRGVWVDRARVVDQWYLTAYEPILDVDNRVVGALYVGLLERPYILLKTRAALLLLGLLAIGGGLGYLLARTAAKHLSRPILELEALANRVAEGERHVFLPVATGDEVGHLTDTFNRMTASLRDREEELSCLNRELGLKVAERTAALEERSRQLIRAQEEVARSERLAAVGSLAAGVAHEINNPAAIIRGNAELLLLQLPAGAPAREEVDVILKQTERIGRITQGLLSLAREDRVPAEAVQINALLTDILGQIAHHAPLGRVRTRSDFASTLPPLRGSRERLRQVFTNLILNALQAMAGEGTLSVRTRPAGKGVEIAIGDTGPGIPREIREKIFDPFFTTKSSGTGLGLSISYAIVQSCGGTIEVESHVGQGSTFRVRLPVARFGDSGVGVGCQESIPTSDA